MQVRRVLTAYVLTLGLCLLILAGRAVPEATWTAQDPDGQYDGGGVPAAPRAERPATVTTTNGARPVQVDLQDEDIPFTALLAYRRAADILEEVKPACELPWTLLAAIGRVESNHGRSTGATLGDDGVSRPSTAATEGAGPMRFFPPVWKVVAVDGDGDGERSVDDIDDAALAAAVYLCAEGENLETPASMATAVRGYDDANRYVGLVLAFEKLYRAGDFLVSASSGAAAPAAVVLEGPQLSGTPFAPRPEPSPREQRRIEDEVRKTVAAVVRSGATAGSASPAASLTASATPTEARASRASTPSASPSLGPTAAASTGGSGSTSPDSTESTPADGSSDGEAASPPSSGATSGPDGDGGAAPAPSASAPSDGAGGGTSPPDEPAPAPNEPGPNDPSPSEPPPSGSDASGKPDPCAPKNPDADPSPATSDPGDSTDPDSATADPTCEPTPSPSPSLLPSLPSSG